MRRQNLKGELYRLHDVHDKVSNVKNKLLIDRLLDVTYTFIARAVTLLLTSTVLFHVLCINVLSTTQF